MRQLLVLLFALLLSGSVAAQEPVSAAKDAEPQPTPAAAPAPAEGCPGGVCVSDDDMAKIIEVLREKRCLQTEVPEFKLDPVKIILDKQGRVFYSGAEPHPYTIHMNWCGYEVEAKGKVELLAAMVTPPIWGFRFRPKAYLGVLPGEVFYHSAENKVKELAGEPTDSLGVADVFDAGVMVDFLYYDWLNLNVALGFRSFGAGLGADLTENFGLYLGYANTWGSWHHNALVGMWFSFYNP